LCRIIKSKGGFAEVVSRLEYDLAIKIGQQPNKIVFNGPVEHYEDIELALENGSIVNLDSWSEIDHVAQYANKNAKKEVKVGLRINIGPDPAGQYSQFNYDEKSWLSGRGYPEKRKNSERPMDDCLASWFAAGRL
jgi:diaminopimelate decarboxylase